MNQKKIKFNLTPKWLAKNRGLSSLIMVGALFGGLNWGVHSILEQEYDFRIEQAQKVAGIYNETNLNNILNQDTKTLKSSFHFMPFYESNHILSALEYIKIKHNNQLDLTHEKETLALIDKTISYQVSDKISYIYEHSDKKALTQNLANYENILKFNNLIKSEDNQTTNKNKIDASSITEADKNQYKESIQALNQYNQEFVKLSYQYDKKDFFSFDSEIFYFTISLGFTLFFWLGLGESSTKENEKRKLNQFILKKLDSKSRKKVRKIYQEIKNQTHLPQKNFSLEKVNHIYSVFKQQGLNFNTITSKKRSYVMTKWDSLYLGLIPLTLSILFLMDTHHILKNAIVIAISLILLLIENTSIYDTQHVQKYIINNYQKLSQEYPDEILKLFLQEPSQEIITLVENHLKQNMEVDLQAIFEEFKLHHNASDSTEPLNIKEDISVIQENVKHTKYLNM